MDKERKKRQAAGVLVGAGILLVILVLLLVRNCLATPGKMTSAETDPAGDVVTEEDVVSDRDGPVETEKNPVDDGAGRDVVSSGSGEEDEETAPEDVTVGNGSDEDTGEEGDDDQGLIHFLEYKGHHYYYAKKPMTWKQADRYCRSRGGYLATVNDIAEQGVLVRALQKSRAPLVNYWIGLNRIGDAKNWMWSNGEPSGFTWWCRNEPNNFEGKETCAEIWLRDPVPVELWKWNDRIESYANLYILETETPLPES